MSVKDADFDVDEDGNGDNNDWECDLTSTGEKRLFWQKDFQIEASFEEKDCDDEDQK